MGCAVAAWSMSSQVWIFKEGFLEEMLLPWVLKGEAFPSVSLLPSPHSQGFLAQPLFAS